MSPITECFDGTLKLQGFGLLASREGDFWLLRPVDDLMTAVLVGDINSSDSSIVRDLVASSCGFCKRIDLVGNAYGRR